ncbi:nucleoporin complex subunit 54-domain-containing protein [Cladochytrium replicatum]|nr:nucleoporin complex subunit 54-domain-containing protein [Cladochytrium replicatum]
MFVGGFGAATPQAGTGGGIFGAAATPGGAATPGTSFFGANTPGTNRPGFTTSTPAPGALGQGGFGSATPFGATPAGATTPGQGLFGKTNTTSAFGAGTATAPAFGAGATTTPGFGTSATGFGAGSANRTGGSSLFGGGGGFGTGLGAGSGTAGFGGQGQGGGMFGASTSGGFMQGGANAGPQQVPGVWQQAEQIKAYFSTNSPHCQFRHYFYNMVHPNDVQFYGRPNNHDETLWNQAQRDNPDPTCMVPALAVGFDDLKKRLQLQEEANQAHRLKLEASDFPTYSCEMTKKIQDMERAHHLETTIKLAERKRKYVQLAHTVIRLMKSVQVLRNLGYSVRQEEESLRVRLESMATQLRNPAQFRGRVGEIASQLAMLKDARASAAAASAAGMGGELGDNVVLDEGTLKLLYKVLAEQHTGLSHLTDVIQTDMKDISIMEAGYPEAGAFRG